MKTYRFLPLLLSAGLIAAGSLNLNAATSGTVGAVTFDIATGPTVVSFPFLQEVVFQSEVASVSSADVTVSGTVPSLVGPHYVHVLSGTDVGRIYPIDSFAGSVVTLTNVPSGIAATDIVAIRPYTTLADLGSPPNFTTFTFLEAGGSPSVFIYGFGTWGAVDPSSVIIKPGEAVVVNNSAVWSITLYGSVSEDDVIFEAANGPQLVGNIDPVNGSADIIQTLESGAPLFSTVTELGVGGAPTNYIRGVSGWSLDPSDNIDTANYKSVVLNTISGADIVNAGNVIAP
jgi:hypothetical protein